MLFQKMHSLKGGPLDVLQLSYGPERTNCYLLVDGAYTLVVDPCTEAIVNELATRSLIPEYVLLTHEHCDHLWGLNMLRLAFPNAAVIAQKECSRAICDPKKNKARQYHIYAALRFGTAYDNQEAKNRVYRCSPADIEFDERYQFLWRGHSVELRSAPGHSMGSVIITVKGAGTFTGDSMLLDQDAFVDFEGGDAHAFQETTLPMLNEISAETLIFPGHGQVFQKKVWRNEEVDYGRASKG